MKAERNAPCPCGSGKKFKKCHYVLDHEADRQARIARAEDDRRVIEERLRQPSKQTLAAVLGMVAAVAR